MARRRDILRCVKMLRPLLCLEDWNIEVKFDDAMEHSGECRADPEYQYAVLTFSPKKIDTRLVLAYAAHELLHCHIWALAHVAEVFANKDKQKLEMVRLAEEALTTRMEHIICGLLKPRP